MDCSGSSGFLRILGLHYAEMHIQLIDTVDVPMLTGDPMKTAEIAQIIADDCIGVRVRMLNRLVTRVYDDRLRPYGIRFSQMNILTLISLRGQIQPAEIGKILSLEKSTLSRNVRLMEENGWIISSPVPTGNGQLLELSAQGRTLYRKASKAWNQAQDHLSALLGDQATKAIRRAVDTIRAENSDV